MATSDDERVFRRFIDEVVSRGRLDVVDELFHADAVFWPPGAPEPGRREVVKAFIAGARSAFPDLTVKVEEILPGDNWLVARVTASGTNEGEFMGFVPIHRKVTWSVVHIARFSGGKIVEERPFPDFLSLLRQLGQLPS